MDNLFHPRSDKMSGLASREKGNSRICVVGAGPCGLTALKTLLQSGLDNIVCYEESDGIGGNWAFSEDPNRTSVYDCTHIISSKALSSFDDFPMPKDYPDFPSHRQLLGYFRAYADAFKLSPNIRLKTRVEQAVRRDDGRWAIRLIGDGGQIEEIFDYLIVCSGHHREPHLPHYPGEFAGPMMHSSRYRRPDAFRGQNVLVVGSGNSACDIAVDISRVANQTFLSMREGTYFIPKLMFGQPIDVVYAFWRSKVPKSLFQFVMRIGLYLAVGRWEDYGLETPKCAPLEKHPTLNSSVLEGLRHGRILARRGIDRFDGQTVHFADGRSEKIDAIVMGTGFRTSFPFLAASVVNWDTTKPPPLYLKMMHKDFNNLFFVGLFQPIGCIWQLADYQAQIIASQIKGCLKRPSDLDARIEHEMAKPHWPFHPSPRHAIEVDYHDFRRELLNELASSAA